MLRSPPLPCRKHPLAGGSMSLPHIARRCTKLSEVEVSVGVVVRDVLDHLMDECHFTLRQLPVLNIFSDEVAENASEIFVSRI